MSRKLNEKKQKFEGGATRSETLERFDIVPGIAELKNAQRFGLGAIKHGENNWKKGGVKFIKLTVSHIQGHLSLLKRTGQLQDDNIAAILCGTSMLAWFELNKPTEFKQAIKEMAKS